MSSLTKTPAQESVSADSATSVPASASTTTSYKKRVEDKAAAPETIIEGSSVWNTYGSMPTDYGSDISDVPMEDGEVPPQQPTPSRPESRMSRSQGRVDPVKMIRALRT
ncbi:hypothetical protein PC129_g9836 [Phytophthora cactorum]|uniref:Uncharacterized protein n=1 Tax=Phytophthora cactorum TaxID=29920 RepID=A0A8T1E6W6_9STRA|nr:hypothetical protein PC114_g25860 [Phytophthora cactorum]KAG2874340.1 hypothetical protein PC115_g24174 [Phytophthora cactorum]KAG2950157.1 hypothetical protein PC118_g25279 [Phytophthora cactorum]KAG2967657.1 hypothetical protein PC119_g24414 [Phytophthora cactorum]KAG3162272.1 hypothetical protein C6341_g13358 [Phytophthora cactorum]